MKNNIKVVLAKRLSMLLFFMVVALVSGCQILLPNYGVPKVLKFREAAMEILNYPEGINRENVNRERTSMRVTPLAAAILFAPDRVPEIIGKGAQVNDVIRTPWVLGSNHYTSYMELAIDRSL